MQSRSSYHSGFRVNFHSSTVTWKYRKLNKRNGTEETGDRRLYLHLYYNDQKAVDDKAAFNALLKTLEEPTGKLLFLLVTHKPQQLLPTILSRCLGLTVHTPTREAGVTWLTGQGVKNPEQALAQTGFAPLQALNWAESGEGAEERGILLNAIQHPAKLDALALADSLQRSAPVHVIHCLQQWCHDLASVKLAGSVRYFPEQNDKLAKLAAGVSSTALLRFQRELLEARRSAFHPLNPKLLLESLLLSYRQLFAA